MQPARLAPWPRWRFQRLSMAWQLSVPGMACGVRIIANNPYAQAARLLSLDVCYAGLVQHWPCH